MKPSTKDEINGNVHEVKGAVKEAMGKVTNNPELEAKGKAEHTRTNAPQGRRLVTHPRRDANLRSLTDQQPTGMAGSWICQIRNGRSG